MEQVLDSSPDAGFTPRTGTRADRRVADVAPTLPTAPAQTETVEIERRSGRERRSMDQLRSEALRALIDRVEDRNFNGLRGQVAWRPRVRLSRVLLLVVSLVAGGIAAALATQANQVAEPQPVAAPVVVEPVPEAKVQILVAQAPVAVGQRLSASLVGWEDWPEAAVRPEYLSATVDPAALDTIGDMVARVSLFPGEPLRAEKLAPAGEGSYLAAVLGAGKRAVSVTVSADAASGGFIVPSDRVDVVLTRSSETGTQVSETVLADVRVLAMGAQLGAAEAEAGVQEVQAFTGTSIATLELDSIEAEIVTSAMMLGRLTLTLRSSTEAPTAAPRPADQLIRMTSPFWRK